MKIIIETQFFAPISVFVFFAEADEILIEKHENYQKRSYRNRCEILNANGVSAIAVPLQKGKNMQQNIGEVNIFSERNWSRNFIHHIQSAYGKSPYFPHYSPDLFEIIRSGTFNLYELNMKLLLFVRELLDWDTPIKETGSYVNNYAEPYVDLRDKLSPASRKLAEKRLNLFHYPQVFEHKFGFTPNLSILDLLFNMGPESAIFLEKANKKTD